MITEIEYNRRVEENSKELQRQLASNCWDLKKFHGADALAGKVSRSVLNRKVDDLYAAVYIGALVYFTPIHGADAMLMCNGKLMDIELKTCSPTISKESTFRTPGGAIYVTSPKHINKTNIARGYTRSITSAFDASFDKTSRERAMTKKFDTYLVMFDTTSDSVIDCYMLDGKIVSKMLAGTFTKGKFGKTDRDVRGCSSIKLGSFKQYGTCVKLAESKAIGFDQWKNMLLDTIDLPTISVY